MFGSNEINGLAHRGVEVRGPVRNAAPCARCTTIDQDHYMNGVGVKLQTCEFFLRTFSYD